MFKLVNVVETTFLKGDIKKVIEDPGAEVVKKVTSGVICCISVKKTTQHCLLLFNLNNLQVSICSWLCLVIQLHDIRAHLSTTAMGENASLPSL